MKKINIKKEKEEQKVIEQYPDSWLYMILLTSIVILAEALKRYTFKIDSISLTYALCILPFQYFLVNFIVKKYNYKEALKAILLSAISLIIFVFVMCVMTNRSFNFSDIGGEFTGYLLSQIVNLMIYCFLINNTKQSFILIYLTYLFALVVDYLFYMILSLNMLMFDSFWIAYFSTLLLQSIICLMLTFLDTQIKQV